VLDEVVLVEFAVIVDVLEDAFLLLFSDIGEALHLIRVEEIVRRHVNKGNARCLFFKCRDARLIIPEVFFFFF